MPIFCLRGDQEKWKSHVASAPLSLRRGPQQTKPKKCHFMSFSQGHSGTKVQYVNRACFPKENTRIHTKTGEIHELFVLALSLVWFAGATPDSRRLLFMCVCVFFVCWFLSLPTNGSGGNVGPESFPVATLPLEPLL